MEVLGIDHLDLTVRSLDVSTPFYNEVLGALGFSRVAHESYLAWSNGIMTIALREGRGDALADRTRAGLHHLSLRSKTRDDVDRFYQFLIEKSARVLDAPAEYPQYGPAYYAVFFADPDGIKLEYLHFPWGYWRRVQEDGRDERPRYEGARRPS